MPATSEKQRRWAYANKGAAWTKKHHFDKVDETVKADLRPAAKRRARKGKK